MAEAISLLPLENTCMLSFVVSFVVSSKLTLPVGNSLPSGLYAVGTARRSNTLCLLIMPGSACVLYISDAPTSRRLIYTHACSRRLCTNPTLCGWHESTLQVFTHPDSGSWCICFLRIGRDEICVTSYTRTGSLGTCIASKLFDVGAACHPGT